jgi:HlyD family secretion protein
MSLKKIIIIGLIAVVVLTLVIVTVTKDTTNRMDVYADEVTEQELIELVSASGRVQPKTKVDITSEITAEIVYLAVREGDRVQTGDLLVILDTVQTRSDVDQALFAVNEVNARLEGAKSTLDQNEEEYERQKRLYESGLTSETAYTNAQYAYRNAKSGYEATKALADQLQSRYRQQLDRLEKVKIVAPMPGVITFLDCEVGEIAPAQTAFTQGKTLMTIADLDVYEVEVEVDETEIAKVDMGQEVAIEVDAFPDTVFNGEVVEIGNTAIYVGQGTQDQSTNFRVKVVFSDANPKIRPGMSATVDITTNRKDETLTVPFSAIVMRDYDLDSLERARTSGDSDSGEVQAAESDSDTTGKSAGEDDEPEEHKGVFVIRDGLARFVEVETGIADQKRIEVVSGITAGDSVISGPYRVLRSVHDGDGVKIVERQSEGTM